MRTPHPLRLASLAVVTALFADGVPVTAQSVGDVPGITWEPYSTMGSDDQPLEGRLGRITVPENRGADDGRTIELAFVVFPSDVPDPGPPIVFLAGGPGGSGIEGCVGPATGRRVRLLEHGDVIGLDQRGTGMSVPNLTEMPDFSWELPADHVLTREDVIAADVAANERMAAFWSEQRVDLSAYNSAESADDIEALRVALGLDEIALYGSSYGSHLGLAYLRRHGEHVARAALSKVEGPDHTWKLPSQIQAQLQRVHDIAAADPAVSEVMPDVLGVVRQLLDQLADEPVRVTVEGENGAPLDVVCGPYDLQRAITSLMADRKRLGRLPWFVHTLAQGDWSILGEISLDHRRGGPFSAMTLMMDCASGATPARRARHERERVDPANLMSDAFDGYYQAGCDGCGDADLGDVFRGPLDCDAPVLFVSGDLDARTPPSNVDEILAGFGNAAHVLVENVGHPPREVLSRDYCRLLKDFLDGDMPESQTISLPPLEFYPLDG